MPNRAWQPAFLGPAAIAIHDDGNVFCAVLIQICS